MSVRARKIFRDLWLNLEQVLFVVLAMALGVFGVGFVLNAYALFEREIRGNLATTNPPSATLWMDRVDAAAVESARSFPGVVTAEAARSPVRARVQVGSDDWAILQLFVVPDFRDLRIAKFFPMQGDWPPADRQILVERSSLPLIEAQIGSTVVAKTLAGTPHELPIAGVVWDPGQDPSWVSGMVYGYITPATLDWLGAPTPSAAGLRIVVRNGLARDEIRDLAQRLGAALQRDGRRILRFEVPQPGQYAQTDRVRSILLVFATFGLLCLLLSGFMSAALVSSQLSHQVRAIGIMKALGASTRQIMGLTFGSVLVQSLAALLMAVPLAGLAGRALAEPTMEWLNFRMVDQTIPLWVCATEVGLGVLVPLLVAAWPIYRGSRITIRQAITDHGVDVENLGNSPLDRLWGKLPLTMPLALSLRNAFRRRGRLLFSLAMLAVGGASFIAALGSAASWNLAIDNAFARVGYDIDVRFAQPYPIEAIEKSLQSIPGVKRIEAWGYAMSAAFPKYSDGTYGGPYAVLAPPQDTVLINPVMAEGRWLAPNEDSAIVVDTDFVDKARRQGTPVQVGGDLTLNLGGRDVAWRLVGIVDKLGFQSSAYVGYLSLAKSTGQTGLAMAARLAVDAHDKVLQRTAAVAVERALAGGGFKVFVIQGLAATRRIMVQHVVIIVAFLFLISALLAGVGGLALASAMALSVAERTRELGILRSLGASTRTILQIVVVEGVIVGGLSWIAASIISIPLTKIIAAHAGQFIFPRVMTTVISTWAFVIWLALVLVVAAGASLASAWKAARRSVREALAYE